MPFVTLSSAPGKTFTSIAEALRKAAGEGDTVLLASGDYEEALEITQDTVTIRPANLLDKVCMRGRTLRQVSCAAWQRTD